MTKSDTNKTRYMSQDGKEPTPFQIKAEELVTLSVIDTAWAG